VRFLLRPGWLAFITLVVGFAVACYALLAPWQFGREEQRDAQERAIAAADSTPPVPLAQLVPAGSAVTPALEWRQVTLAGTYLPDAEAVVRLRVVDGKPAVEVLTPMRLDDGRAVAVDRGYAPVADGQAVPAYAAPPSGPVTLTARLRPDQLDPAHRPVVRGEGPPQLYAADSRVLGATASLDLVPGILQLTSGQPGVLEPVEVGPPESAAPFTNFSYALQWLTFGLIALVALGLFIRLEMLQRRPDGARMSRSEVRRALAGDEPGEPGDPDEPGDSGAPVPDRSGRR
jgi:cytochrome oxidase assembly protein ShyY1